MGIIFLFVLAVAGAIGAVIGGVIGFGLGLALRGTFSPIDTAFGIVTGGGFGLFIGLMIVARALRDDWQAQDQQGGPKR